MPTHDLFNVKLLGGKWLIEHEHRPYDAFCGWVREGTIAEHWFVTYHLNKSIRFDVSKYGQDESYWLSRAWCDRLLHLFNIWNNPSLAEYSYTKEDIDAIAEATAFIQLATEGTRDVKAGVQRVRASVLRL